MFGLTFEKLLLVAVLAGLLVGPRRLPHYAHELARLVRSFRAFVETTRTQAEREMGVSLQPADWNLRQYDPRYVVRTAMREPEAPTRDERVEQARGVRPGQKYVITGTTAHPRRILIESLPIEDPRRIAAQVADETGPGEAAPTPDFTDQVRPAT